MIDRLTRRVVGRLEGFTIDAGTVHDALVALFSSGRLPDHWEFLDHCVIDSSSHTIEVAFYDNGSFEYSVVVRGFEGFADMADLIQALYMEVLLVYARGETRRR